MGYQILAVVAALAIGLGGGYWRGSSRTQLQCDTAELERQNGELAGQVAALDAALTSARARNSQMASIDAENQRRFADAQKAAATTIDDLRRGNLQLRRSATEACAASLRDPAGAASELDGAAVLSIEDQEATLRDAGECDAQVTSLQDIVRMCQSLNVRTPSPTEIDR